MIPDLVIRNMTRVAIFKWVSTLINCQVCHSGQIILFLKINPDTGCQYAISPLTLNKSPQYYIVQVMCETFDVYIVY